MKRALASFRTSKKEEAQPTTRDFKPGSADFFNNALYEFLKESSERNSAERRDGFLHVSNLYDLCPRREIINLAYEEKKDRVEPRLQMIFDHGTAAHEWYRQRYFGPMGYLWGTWRCSRCRKKSIGVMPSGPCSCVSSECDKTKCQPHPKFSCRLCVSEGTFVSMDAFGGAKPIEKLNSGDLVLTASGLFPLKKVWRQPEMKPTLSITTADNKLPLLLTSNHEVYYYAGPKEMSSKLAGSLKVGEKLRTVRNGRQFPTEILLISDGPVSKVWDLEVDAEEDEHHNFFANGVLVHNCSRWGQWEYLEEQVWFPSYGVKGSCDGILTQIPGDLQPKRVWEIKTIDKRMFDRLSFPYTRHLAQASIYAVGLHCKNLLITYIPKGDSGEPPKSFRSETDEALAFECLDRAKRYWSALRRGILPKRLCENEKMPKAVQCPSRKICFSDNAETVIEEAIRQRREEGKLEWVKESLAQIQA